MAAAMTDHPQPMGAWARIEKARKALGWNEGELSENALGGRTHYSLIRSRGRWVSKTDTQEKLFECLEQKGFSAAWLRAGILPEMSSGEPLPVPDDLSAQLKDLARKLALKPEQVLDLWADLKTEGPLQKYPEELQRAAFAASYLENRTLEDVRRAVDKARNSEQWKSNGGIDQMLTEIRLALRSIKPSGSGTVLSIRPKRDG